MEKLYRAIRFVDSVLVVEAFVKHFVNNQLCRVLSVTRNELLLYAKIFSEKINPKRP